MDHNRLWKILKEIEISDHLTCLLRNLYAGQEETVRTGHGTTDWFQIQIYFKAVYCHLAYLTYAQSTSCKMPGWMKHKLESRLPREISTTSDMQITTTIHWKILKEMGIPDHLTCLLTNLYPGQEATVKTGHGTTDWFQIGR